MSLRAFHLFFIGLSVVLAAFCAAWSGGQYRLGHEAIYAVSSVGSLAFGGGPRLVRGGLSAQDQGPVMRRAWLTAALLAAPRVAWACPVCFGQSDSPLAKATNMGIIVMLGVVAAVLSGFAAFIVNLNRRARLVEKGVVTPTAVGHSGPPSTTPQEGIAQC